MVEYKIVKYCRLCKKRYVVNRGEAKKIYCVTCQRKITRSLNAANKTAKKKTSKPKKKEDKKK